MATKKAAGSTKNGRDSTAKRLGVKLFGGQTVSPGNIIIRQRGTKYFPGEGTRMGKDHTIYSVAEGSVKFSEVQMKKFNGQIHKDKVVHVVKSA